eukprot:CAMPEP_0177654486 /NCGR_PEP_ID=MMETSP0447-20121125/14361_1 /TAXON_ID=0 /ORGANISM="Stygamoeba regulata, Strain BSH-02190019" /LENGTH=152 /DNA_ID=CAMNT_0019158145 /DNA_START=278 /DNA_END=736 /DNA_ORIENTATION=+
MSASLTSEILQSATEEVTKLTQAHAAHVFHVKCDVDRVATPHLSTHVWTPTITEVETDDTFVLSVELPGVRFEDVKTTVHDKILTIRAHRTLSLSEGVFSPELGHSDFQQTWLLDHQVSQSDLMVLFHNGIFTINIPKMSGTIVKPQRIEKN